MVDGFVDSHGAECEWDRTVCQRGGQYYKTSSCNSKKQLWRACNAVPFNNDLVCDIVKLFCMFHVFLFLHFD